MAGGTYPGVLTSAITSGPGSQERLAAQSSYRHFRPRTLAGKPSCDGTPSELCVIDLITQHDVTADEQFPGGRGLGFWPPATLGQALIETLEVIVLFDGRMRGFDQQVAQHARAGFADAQEMFALSRRTFHWFEPGISSHLPLIAKAADRPQRMHHTERG